MQKTNSPSVFLGTLIFATLYSVSSWSQDNLKLEQISIRDSQDAFSSSIYSEKVEKKQDKNLGDVLRDSTDVTVGGNQNANQKVYVRGLEDNNLNVTVDGARQSQNMFHHQGRLNVDPDLLKKVNVDAGTGDAMSGPGALGGSLRFETKDAEDFLVPGKNVGAMVKGEYGTNADEKKAALGVYGRLNDSASLLLYGNYSDTNDYKAGGGNKVNFTGGNPFSQLAKLSWRPTDSQKIIFSRTERQDNATRYTRGNFGAAGGGAIADQSLKTTTHSLSYALAPNSPLVNVKANVYTSRDELENSSATSATVGDWESYGGSLQNTFKADAFSLSVGSDYNSDKASGKSTADRINEEGKVFGLFTQGKYLLSSDWIIGAGLRYDDYNLTQVDQTTLTQNHISPNARLVYVVNPQWETELSWSQAFKGATPAQAFLLGGVKSVTPTDDLSGSVAETTQWSLRYKQNPYFGDLAVYDTIIKDPINSSVNRTTGVLTRSNLSPIRSQGVSVNAGYKQGTYAAKLGYAHNKTRFGADPLGYTAFGIGSGFGDRFNLDLEKVFAEHNMTLSWSSVLTLEKTDVPAGQLNQPGYDVHDLSLNWIPSESARVGFVIRNIFDKKYVAQGTVYATGTTEVPLYEMGRDFRLATSFYF